MDNISADVCSAQIHESIDSMEHLGYALSKIVVFFQFQLTMSVLVKNVSL